MRLNQIISLSIAGVLSLCASNYAYAGLPEKCLTSQPRPGLYQLECSVDTDNDGLYDKRTIYKTDLANHTWTKEIDKHADYSIDFIERFYLDDRGMITKREIDRNGDLIVDDTYLYEFDDAGDVLREVLIKNNQVVYDRINDPWRFHYVTAQNTKSLAPVNNSLESSLQCPAVLPLIPLPQK